MAYVEDRNFNNLVQALLTDKYQLSMCYAYFKNSKHEEKAVFDLFFRKNPFGGEYTIFVGLNECLKYLKNFQFTQSDIHYLRNIPDYAHICDDFWTYLQNLNSKSVRLYALREGSVCFPNIPIIRVEGPLGILQIIETTLLNLINYPCLVATNAARYRQAASLVPNCKLLEFGLRRAQGPDGGLSATLYSYIAGFDATSNLAAGKLFNIPVSGTMGHAFIMSYSGNQKLEREPTSGHKFLLNKKTNETENFTLTCLEIQDDFMRREVLTKKCQVEKSKHASQTEFEACIAFAWAFPDNFLALVDTTGDVIKSGLVNFSIVAIGLFKFGYKPIGIRIDSGDLAYLSRFARELFTLVGRSYDIKGFDNLEIVASNDINEETINSLNEQKHAITSLGIGTHLVTCQSQPALGCVYKLVEVNDTPCMKLSSMPEKITIPCKKCVYRLYGRDGTALLDLITIHNEQVPQIGQRILCRHPFVAEKRCYVTPSRVESLLSLWWDGKPVEEEISLERARDHCINSVSFLTQDIKRSLNPTPYKVSVSEKLFNLLNELRVSLTPIGELS